MTNSKRSSLRLGARKPYEPIRRALDIPPALFEMATLIERGINGDAEALAKASVLQESIISVALDYPDCLSQIRNLLVNGYAIEFAIVGPADNLETSDGFAPVES